MTEDEAATDQPSIERQATRFRGFLALLLFGRESGLSGIQRGLFLQQHHTCGHARAALA